MDSLKQRLKRVEPIARANAAIKAVAQERRAARSLRACRARAAQLGVTAPTGAALVAALRSRLAGRRGGRSAARMGGMHVFLAYYVSNWEAVLPLTLEPFGRVTPFEWRSRGFDDRAADWLARRDAMNRAMLEAFHDANRQRPVDAVVGYLSGYNTSPDTLGEMASAGATVFNFCWDDKLHLPGPLVGGRDRSPAALAAAVDLNLTNAPESVIKYAAHGGLAMFWPPGGYPPQHRPHDVPFEYDVSFVGARYGWRPRFIERLRRLGVNVTCFGHGWPNGPLGDEEMITLYSRSRINLGFAGVGHCRRLMCIKGRDIEVPMSGGLYLTQDNPELARLYDVGREVVTYQDEADCARQIRDLLSDPDRCAAIRAAGRARALREHTWEARWREVFQMAGLLESGGNE